MTPQAYADLVATKYKGRTHFHCMTVDSGLVVDGGSFGGEARFINHACDPNCEVQKWNVLGQWRIGIFARRKIAAGEELAYVADYACRCIRLSCAISLPVASASVRRCVAVECFDSSP
jgi:hypothetical protein